MKTLDSIREQYEQTGVDEFYRQHGATYRNPHEGIIRALLHRVMDDAALDITRVLDLACGSGEVTLLLRERGCTWIEGIDPYTGAAYHERTGQTAEPYTFEQIGTGALMGRTYSLIVCSFALHLLRESWLPLVGYQLAQLSPTLLIVTPNKRPMIKAAWGWALEREWLHERVRARLYQNRLK